MVYIGDDITFTTHFSITRSCKAFILAQPPFFQGFSVLSIYIYMPISSTSLLFAGVARCSFMRRYLKRQMLLLLRQQGISFFTGSNTFCNQFLQYTIKLQSGAFWDLDAVERK